MESRRSFLKGIVLIGFGFTAFFALEGLLEWWRLGRPGLEATSWGGVNNTKLVDILSPMARAYNNVLAMLLSTVGLAIPLTANMHTPKLIDMFLRDRLNQVMLILFAFGAANVLFVDYLVGPDFAPMWAYRISIIGALLGWAVLIPYFFYVVRFLDPSQILTRLKDQVTAEIDRAAAGKVDVEKSQDVIHERLSQIGTICLKSIDRADRSVVLEGIWALKQLCDHYGARKASMPDAWFKVDRKDFVGLSNEALEIINEGQTWFEHKVGRQLYLAYQAALAKSPDAISSLSDAARVIATNAAARGDELALQLLVRYFNNFLREAIKKKDTHAIYDLFYQYRLLGRDAGRDRPELLRQIGRSFRFYSETAASSGLEFIPQLAGFDLGWLVRRAYETKSAAADGLLGDVLALDHMPRGKAATLLVKAKMLLGGAFLEAGQTAQAARVAENLGNVPPETLAMTADDLMAVSERCFWEVTDRQVNFEFMGPERREHVRAFIASLGRVKVA